MKKSTSFLLFHRTSGAEYDSRIQKILSSLARCRGISGRAVLWERDNQPRTGSFPRGGTYEVKKLPIASRKCPRPGPLISLFEIVQEAVQAYRLIRKEKAEIVIVENHRLFLLVMLLTIARSPCLKRLVWDLMELPVGFLKVNSLRATLFAKLLTKCDSVVVVNEPRLAYMKNIYGEKILHHAKVISNFVDAGFADGAFMALPAEIENWLQGRQFYYIQNPIVPARYPDNAIRAVLESSDKAIVVTGGIPERTKIGLKNDYGKIFKQRVYLSKMVPQEKLPTILDSAYASLILYNSDYPNNDCCDANRLYQAIARGIPVVVGNNQGMKWLVQKEQVGVVLDDDGRDQENIQAGIRTLEKNYFMLKSNAEKSRNKFLWENNETRLLEAILG